MANDSALPPAAADSRRVVPNPPFRSTMTLWILFAIAPLLQQPATGTLRGRVTVAGSSQPVANARIEISSPITADGEGRFEIGGLAPGSPSITVSAPGYVSHEGRMRIVEGETATLNIELTPTASLSGRITDELGRPLAGILVQVLKPSYDFGGRRFLQDVRSAYSDDRGIYRIFWIPPGRYQVAAGFGDQPRRTTNEVRGEKVIGVYYPRTLDPEQASTIELKPAAEVIGTDFSFRRLRTRTITGRVIDEATGTRPVSSDVNVDGGRYDPASGTFTISDVGPGLQVIHATVMEAVPPGGFRESAHGRTSVLVEDADVDGVTVRVTTPPTIRGRLVVEGETGSLRGAKVGLVPLDADGAIGYGDVEADGTFTLNAAPGRYRVSVDGTQGLWQSPRNSYLKDVRFNFADALNRPVAVTADEGSTLSVVYSPNGAELHGTVLDDKLQPVAGATIALIPNRRDRLDLYRSGYTDEQGQFKIGWISPGDYKAFAWTSLETNAYFDPELAKRHEQQGQPLHFLERSSVTAQLRVIP